jgi:hypothetical protein
MTTFDLWPLPLGGGAWGAGTNMWHPKTLAIYDSLSAPLATQLITLWKHISGGRGRRGALILDRCRAFDLFASVDAHLWFKPRIVKCAKVTLSSSVDLDKSSPTTPTWPGTWIIKGTVHCELLRPIEPQHTWERGEVKWYVAAGWACCVHLKCKKWSNGPADPFSDPDYGSGLASRRCRSTFGANLKFYKF